jgi:tetratricopeptide (TPR) repeat protein
MYDVLIEAEFVSAEIWNNRAECLACLEQIDASLESFDRAIELDSGFAPAWFGKARALTNEQRIDETRPVAQRYLELADEVERSAPAVQTLMTICGIDR